MSTDPTGGGSGAAAANESAFGLGAEEAKRFRAYRDSGDREQRNEIVASYVGLATSVARRFAGRGEPLDDLVQVANFGLVKAVERFDPDRGTSFASFAVPTMLGEIKRHFRDHTWSARVPRSAKDLLPRVSSAIESLSAELHRSPNPEEVAERIGSSVEAVIEALDARSMYRPASLSALAPERNEHPGLAAADRGLGAVDDELTVRSLLEMLPERERRIVELRYFQDMTQSEIASIVGLSQMHVSRLLRQALASLAARSREPIDP
jgi:RNA polymerase sigma-B factor